MNDTLTTYNGWSNRETWLVSLWLNNDRFNYELLADAYKQNSGDFEQAEWLEQQLRYQLDDEVGSANLWSDLLSTAFGRISWVEVIEKNQ